MFGIISANYNLVLVVVTVTLLGFTFGGIGSYLFYRRQSLTSDLVAHSTLPGVILSYLLCSAFIPEKNFFVLLVGGVASAMVTILVHAIFTKNSKIDVNTSLAILISVSFSFAVTLISMVSDLGLQLSGIEHYILGKPTAISLVDLSITASVCSLAFTFCLLSLRGMTYAAFDFEYSKVLRIAWIEFILLLLTMLLVIAGMQAVGIILVVALMIIPAACSSQVVFNYRQAFWLSSLLGALCASLGAYLSYIDARLPCSAMIVLLMSGTFLVLALGRVYFQRA